MSGWGDEGARPRSVLLGVIIVLGTLIGLYLAWKSGAFNAPDTPAPSPSGR